MRASEQTRAPPPLGRELCPKGITCATVRDGESLEHPRAVHLLPCSSLFLCHFANNHRLVLQGKYASMFNQLRTYYARLLRNIGIICSSIIFFYSRGKNLEEIKFDGLCNFSIKKSIRHFRYLVTSKMNGMDTMYSLAFIILHELVKYSFLRRSAFHRSQRNG